MREEEPTVRKTHMFRLAALAAALLLAVSAGCAGPLATPPGGGETVTDCAGRRVELPREVRRVAVLDAFSGEAVIMLGAGEKMVAVPNGVKSDRLLREIYPGLADVAVPMSEATVNAEAVLALGPDLVLLKESLYQSEGEREKIEKLGIPYLVIGYTDMEEQIQAIRLIGASLGREEKAEEICRYYEAVIQQARAIAAEIPEEERVRVYHAINEVIRTDGPDTLGSDWIDCVGAVNVSVEGDLTLTDGDYYASMEQIYLWNPDVVICNEASTADYLYLDSKWAGLDAVENRRVYNIPVAATRWGQRGSLETFFAILWLGTTLYPEYYSHIDLKEEVVTFYQNVLGLTIDDAVYGEILSGNGIRKASGVAP